MEDNVQISPCILNQGVGGVDKDVEISICPSASVMRRPTQAAQRRSANEPRANLLENY